MTERTDSDLTSKGNKRKSSHAPLATGTALLPLFLCWNFQARPQAVRRGTEGQPRSGRIGASSSKSRRAWPPCKQHSSQTTSCAVDCAEAVPTPVTRCNSREAKECPAVQRSNDPIIQRKIPVLTFALVRIITVKLAQAVSRHLRQSSPWPVPGYTSALFSVDDIPRPQENVVHPPGAIGQGDRCGVDFLAVGDQNLSGMSMDE